MESGLQNKPVILLFKIGLNWTFIINRVLSNATYHKDPSSWNPIASAVSFPDLGLFERGPRGTYNFFLPDSPSVIGAKFWYASLLVKEIHYYRPTTLDFVFEDSTIAVIVHGFGSSADDYLIEKLRNSILRFTAINGTIVVDWENGSKLPNYFQAASNTQVVGRQLAFLLQALRTRRNINPENIHLICFSLGCHLCGFAGKWTQSEYGFLIGRISGLDAASPFFESTNGHLTSTDANYVDVIHTSSGTNILRNEFGFTKPIGHVDFYPNGGVKQPQCEGKDRMCNHLAALIYYDASIRYAITCEFRSVQCPTYGDFNKQECDLENVSRMGFYSILEMGYGKQYLNTTSTYPHGICHDLFY